MKVMRAKCPTCPFNEDGVREIRTTVESYIFTRASQTCHGVEDTMLCRGARDQQLQFFHRLGFLREPTDQAWKRASDKLARQRAR